MFNATQNKLLLEAVDLLYNADALIQQALGASDECYETHLSIECAAEDILDIIRANNPEEVL